MPSMEWSEASLRISEEERGLRVEQCGRSYLAKMWALSPEVLAVVELALENGLSCLMRRGHPSESKLYETGGSVDYLCFSPTPEHHWVFGLDMDSCRGGGARRQPRRVKFSKRYRHILRANDIACLPEWRSPQHLHVDLTDLRRALAVVSPHVDSLGAMSGRRLERGAHPFFVDEEDLHAHLVRHWRNCPVLQALTLLHSKLLLNGIAHRQGEIDLLASDRERDLFVIELKDTAKANITESPVRQLIRYMEHPEVLDMARTRGGAIFGMLIAQDLGHDVCKEVAQAEHPILAYEATKLPESIKLTLLATSSYPGLEAAGR